MLEHLPERAWPLCKARLQCLTLCLFLLQEGQRAYYKLRLERTNAKLIGVRAKRAAEAAAEEAAKAK